jgi:hypothetical protein
VDDACFQVEHVDADHLLVAEHGREKTEGAQEQVYVTCLYLVRIKYSKWNGAMSNWEGTVLDTIRLEKFYFEDQILFHPEDRHKFTIFESDEFFTAVKGRIEGGKIVLTKKVRKVKFDMRLCCKRMLDDNNVQGLQNMFKSPANT